MDGNNGEADGAFRGQGGCQPSVRAEEGGMRGQAAVEALSYGAFFMLIFVGAVAVFLQMQSQDLSRAEYSYAQQVAYGFADSIYVTSLAGDGFAQVVSVPTDILGRSYNITISRPQSGAGSQAALETGFVYVEWLASNGKIGSVSAPTITTKYGMVAYGSLISNNTREFIVIGSGAGKLNLYNVNGTIMVSKA